MYAALAARPDIAFAAAAQLRYNTNTRTGHIKAYRRVDAVSRPRQVTDYIIARASTDARLALPIPIGLATAQIESLKVGTSSVKTAADQSHCNHKKNI